MARLTTYDQITPLIDKMQADYDASGRTGYNPADFIPDDTKEQILWWLLNQPATELAEILLNYMSSDPDALAHELIDMVEELSQPQPQPQR